MITVFALNSILGYMEIGKKEGKLLCGGGRADGPGYFLQPTIFGDVPAGARIEQEEIFGPVLSVTKADNYDHAIQIANGTIYGLTGEVFSRRQARLEQARRDFHGHLAVAICLDLIPRLVVVITCCCSCRQRRFVKSYELKTPNSPRLGHGLFRYMKIV